MISSLLKNRGLRRQLLVGLLLVLGTFPEPSEGLKCYCGGTTGGTDCTEDTKECNSNQGYCHKYLVNKPDGDVVLGSGCWTSKEAQCFRGKFEGKNCVTETDPGKAGNGHKDFRKCFNSPGRQEQEENFGQGFRACFCDTDLCNKDECFSCNASGDGSGGKGGEGSGGEGGHSTSGLIVAILTVAVYNYT